jgi:ABC-type sugar transport system substrate-binding protein
VRIALFSPSSPTNTYWPQAFHVLREVGKDLGFEVTTHEFGAENRFSKLRAALAVLRSDPKPDAVMTSLVAGDSKVLIEAASAAGVPVVVLGPLYPAEAALIGGAPRVKYPQWIATFSENDEEKGYLLAKALLRAAEDNRAYARDGSIQVIAVSGDTTWHGSAVRQAGLQRALVEFPRARLRQIAPTYWNPTEGHDMTMNMLRRFPEATVVWAASDQLAIGAAGALVESGRVLGRNAFTGGLDLSDNGLLRVQEGKLVATAASPMLRFAAISICLYDYLQGIDFANELGTEVSTELAIATRVDAQRYLELSKHIDAIDFRAFSKAHNAKRRSYDFSLEAFLAAASLPPITASR